VQPRLCDRLLQSDLIRPALAAAYTRSVRSNCCLGRCHYHHHHQIIMRSTCWETTLCCIMTPFIPWTQVKAPYATLLNSLNVIQARNDAYRVDRRLSKKQQRAWAKEDKEMLDSLHLPLLSHASALTYSQQTDSNSSAYQLSNPKTQRFRHRDLRLSVTFTMKLVTVVIALCTAVLPAIALPTPAPQFIGVEAQVPDFGVLSPDGIPISKTKLYLSLEHCAGSNMSS
jgi:hypothetical protein